MSATIAVALLAIVLGLGIITALTATADHHARAEAWRRIALERRWNHENITAAGDRADEVGPRWRPPPPP